MNPLAQTYWDTYWGNNEKPKSVTAWQFGDSPDYLAKLVIDGVKTATCSGHIFYELENESLPTTNNYSIVLNSQDEPVAIIKTIEVTVTPMNEVTEEFAIAEGEGDLTYNYWRDTHIQFFTKELHELGLGFSEDILLVCERFELIDIKNKVKL
ncbi:ASCH domain-containing protein [Bacillus cereus]|uniref:ASCH domain-containing protein n=1 Tax=Bacillus cereus TaxID=1396 RepID=UPI0025705F02|nr:ASCH domain-containing protein [Bacillus cereus]MDM5460568.1 ASCH domain-containing protein [Bacillus cereus]WJE20648.1 ASCH domain-containing protein [Bacillus cereus]